ncbi:hypothetical protein Csa_011841, partial [Cucumis sativus]
MRRGVEVSSYAPNPEGVEITKRGSEVVLSNRSPTRRSRCPRKENLSAVAISRMST